MPIVELSRLDDDELIDRARAGSRDAYGELMRRHQAAAVRLASVICGSVDDAHDVVQDGFLQAYRRLGTYRGEGEVRSWLLRIVANGAKNHVRGRIRRLRRDDRDSRMAIRVNDSAEYVASQHLEHEELAAALRRLRADDRAILACRYIAGLGERETAVVLDLAGGTVKSRTSRALARLSQELERGDG